MHINNIELKRNQKKSFSTMKIIISILLSISLIIIIGVSVYLSDYYHSRLSLDEYQQEYSVSIIENNSIISLKSNIDNGIGIIFYPGGKVEYTAYIPLLEPLAERGYTCFILKMPGNLAVFGIDKADKIIKDNPTIDTWYIAGHSLGGAMASTYVSNNDMKIKGIIFLGAYPSTNLSTTNLTMLSIVGSNDEVVNKEKYESSRTNAPNIAYYNTIDGGNHAGFGDYGEQKGDGVATIRGSEQIDQTIELIDEFCIVK
jgi:hypothetical protein